MLRAVCVPRARLGQRLGSASAPVLELASVTVRTPSGPVAPALRSQVVRQAASSAKAAASTAAVPVAPVNTPLDTDFHGLFTRQAPLFPSPLPPNFVNTYLPHGTDATQNGVLPPLSDDHVRALFTNDLLYPPSGAIEQRAMLRTSIDAGLALRAGKLFDALYHEGVNRFQRLSDLSRPARDARSGTSSTHMQLMQSARLSKRVWDDLINLFLFKAAAVHDEHTKVEFFRRAQILAERMLRACSLKESTNPVYEPNADANTGACLIKGYARMLQSWPDNDRLRKSACDLIITLARVGITMGDIAHSQFWYIDAPAYESEDGLAPLSRKEAMGIILDNAASEEHLATMVLETEVVLERLEQKDNEDNGTEAEALKATVGTSTKKSQALPEIIPTMTTSSSKYAEGITRTQRMDPDFEATPLNLAMLMENLGAIEESRQLSSDPYKRQKWLEDSAIESARKRLKVANESLGAAAKGAMDLGDRQVQLWMWDWFSSMQTELKVIVASIKDTVIAKGEKTDVDLALQPLLKAVSTEKLALIPVLELMSMLGQGKASEGLRVARACAMIGKSIEKEYHLQQAKRRERLLRSEAKHGTASIDRNTIALMGTDFTAPEVRAELKSLAEERDQVWTTPKWSHLMRLKMGSFLLDLLTRVAHIRRSARARDGQMWNQKLPAFYTTYQYHSGRRVGVIKLNSFILDQMDKASLTGVLHPRQLPMLVPPRPWVSHDSGGYFTERKSVMRLKDSNEQGSYLREASKAGQLDKVLASLDVLGQTAWRVNRAVLAVMTEVWNSGEGLGDLPPRHLDVPEPQKPDDYATNLRSRHVYNQLVIRAQAAHSANHSQRCDINYKLEIARAYAEDKFYFPHNIDFRGRAYPIPPNFNHMGNDMCRGLLKFDEAKPLGSHGLRWLKIHTANVFGFDKASLSDREKWTNDHIELVQDSANNPLGGRRWWLEADDAWQCLAACKELTDALNYPEGPEAFPSSLPVHQDGTCNGLQHYAALGGDLAGAQQVNLAQGEKPADVYTGVAELVIGQLDQDAAEGNHEAQLLQGKITRKVVKQTVMTTVYGVTFIGAKAQIKKQLVGKDIPPDELWSTSQYLAKVVLTKIGHLFSGATQIQRWLHMCARLIAKSVPASRQSEAEMVVPVKTRVRSTDGTVEKKELAKRNIFKEQMTSVIWTTALGLPVVQPYRRQKKRQMDTKLQSIFINDPSVNHEVSPQKQASAFPPNFVHSLDATHMMMTALEAHRAGLAFASVHDSYWTHASEVDTLSDLIRETFVLLHSNDILANLRREFLDRYGDHVIYSKDLETCLDELEQTNAGKLPENVRDIPRRSAPRGESANDGLLAAAKVVEEADRKTAPRGRRSRSASTPSAATAKEADDSTRDSSKALSLGRLDSTGYEARERPPFIALSEILPPLPPKGTFDVKEIRRSLYFFS